MYRVYLRTEKGVFESPYAVDAKGQAVKCAIKTPQPVDPASIHKNCPIINSSIKKLSLMNYQESKLPIAVGYIENAAGNLSTSRLETTGLAGTRRPLRVTLDNTDIAEQTVIIGDGFGLFATKNAIPAKDADVIVGGTYGVNTLARLAAICASVPFDLHGLHIANTTTAGASSEAFLLGGTLTNFVISPDMQYVQEIEIPLADEVLQSAFKDNIRNNPNYRFHLNGFSGWKLVIPPGEKVVLTFSQIRAVGTGANMVLLANGGC